MKSNNVIPKLVNTHAMTIREMMKEEGVYARTTSNGYADGRFVVFLDGGMPSVVIYVDANDIIGINTNSDGWTNQRFVQVDESVAVSFNHNK